MNTSEGYLGARRPWITKDSGKREEFTSGMVRDTQDDKPRYDLVDWAMITRWAALMARGAKKYGERNWMKASGEPELRRFKASALRHCIQWFLGLGEEDHGAAVFFNIAGAEMVREKMTAGKIVEQVSYGDAVCAAMEEELDALTEEPVTAEYHNSVTEVIE